MTFEPMDIELEIFLKDIIDSIGEGDETPIKWKEHERELSALREKGLVKISECYYDGTCAVALTHSGSTYFDKRSAWVMQQGRGVVEDLSEKDAEELAKLVVLSGKSKSGLIMRGFDRNDADENKSIARLSQRGFLKTKYADNVPWCITITPEGYDEIKRIAQIPAAKKGKLSTWIAQTTGTFTGAAIKEMNDM